MKINMNLITSRMKTTVFALILSMTMPVAFSQNLNLGLAACYPLDCDNAVNLAATGSAYDAISLPGVSCATGHKGVANTAYYFDGQTSTYIKLPGSGNRLQPSGTGAEFSWSGWVKSDNVSQSQHIVFTTNGCGSYHEGYTLVINDVGSMNYRFRVVKSDGCSSTNQIFLDGSTNLNDGQWYHVGFVITGSTIELYVDGQFETSMSHSQNLVYGSNVNVYLGGTNLGFNHPFQGYLDNVRFYDRALTATEFYALYKLDPGCSDCGLKTYQDSLQACYPLNCDVNNYSPLTSGVGNSLNGTTSNVNCATGHTGGASTAYSFSGNSNSYISFPNDPRLKRAAMTVACWVKIDQLQTDQYIVFTHNGCTSWHEGYAIVAHATGNNVYYEAVKSSNCSGTGQISVNSSAAPSSTNNWQCIVAYFDGNNVKLYVDGTAYTTTGGGALLYNTALVYLGGTNLTFNRPLNGRIDNVKFWSKELTLSEIQFMCDNDIGCDDWCRNDTRPGQPTGLKENSAPGRELVYPNPANGNFFVRGTAVNHILVTDISGKQVSFTTSKVDERTLEVHLPEQCTGIYFVKLFDSNGIDIGTKKIVIQK